jgi:hypothetical protein
MTSQHRGMRSSSSRLTRAILLSYPGAVLFDLDGDTIEEISYRETSSSSSLATFSTHRRGFSSISSAQSTVREAMPNRRMEPTRPVSREAHGSFAGVSGSRKRGCYTDANVNRRVGCRGASAVA